LTTGSVSASPPASVLPRRVIVQSGDTLHTIARRNNVAVYDLMTVNRLTSSRIDVGQALYVPTY
jgi:LysM repeat protein